MQQNNTQQHPDDNELIEVAVSQLSVAMIDWLVAQDEGVPVEFDGECIRHSPEPYTCEERYSPSTDPSIGHPLLEREKLQVRYIDCPGHNFHGLWMAQDCRYSPTSTNVVWSPFGRSIPANDLGYLTGPTMLIAGLRFIIAKHRVGKCKAPAVRVPAKLIKSSKR
jgi:hypothetical protein